MVFTMFKPSYPSKHKNNDHRQIKCIRTILMQSTDDAVSDVMISKINFGLCTHNNIIIAILLLLLWSIFAHHIQTYIASSSSSSHLQTLLFCKYNVNIMYVSQIISMGIWG